jgi:hypothetical protein
MKSAQEIIKEMKIEILRDIDEGVVRVAVSNFAELHEYVDANCYGGFCDESIVDEAAIDLAAHCQGGVSD